MSEATPRPPVESMDDYKTAAEYLITALGEGLDPFGGLGEKEKS